jgi:hypothetical protein
VTQIVFGALTQVQYNSLQAGLVAPVFGEVTAFLNKKARSQDDSRKHAIV